MQRKCSDAVFPNQGSVCKLLGLFKSQASNTGVGDGSSCKVAEHPGEAWPLLVHWLVVSLVSNSYWAFLGLTAHGAYGMMRGL